MSASRQKSYDELEEFVRKRLNKLSSITRFSEKTGLSYLILIQIKNKKTHGKSYIKTLIILMEYWGYEIKVKKEIIYTYSKKEN